MARTHKFYERYCALENKEYRPVSYTHLGFSKVETKVLGQKSELLPLPGKGASGRVKHALLRILPDALAESALKVAGYFLFAIARKDIPETPGS